MPVAKNWTWTAPREKRRAFKPQAGKKGAWQAEVDTTYKLCKCETPWVDPLEKRCVRCGHDVAN